MVLNIKKDFNISVYTTMRTECVARYYVDATSKEEMVAAVHYAADKKVPKIILGGGSNVVFGHHRYNGLVIRNKITGIEVIADMKDEVRVKIGSGAIVGSVIDYCIRNGFEGFEYHFGLPGTIGGAVYMNSKWTRPANYFGDNLISAWIFGGNCVLREVDRDYFRFDYGYSCLQESGEVLTEAVFRLKRKDSSVLRARAQTSLEYRKNSQPVGVATSGCYFKNIKSEEALRLGISTSSAGYLIDSAGLKGLTVGGFTVSPKHANFIVNTGAGRPADLLKLSGIIKKRVYEKYGVKLVEEVIIQ